MGNPFALSFGKKTVQYISRLAQTNQILTAFQEKNPTNQFFMITGVRGGKDGDADKYSNGNASKTRLACD